MKATYEVVSLPIPKKELVGAAKDFLLHHESNKDLMLVRNIDSSRFGSSDFLFIDKDNINLIVGKLSDGMDCEKFIISSISYYFWLKEFIMVDEVIFERKSKLDMYLFSDNFSSEICFFMSNLTKKFGIYLIRYNILHVEDLDEPAIFFQHIIFEDLDQDKLVKKIKGDEKTASAEWKETSVSKLSAQELSEFNRLKALYLE